MQEGTADSPKLNWILLFYFSTLFTHPFWTLTFTFKCHYLKNMFSTLDIILMCMVHLAGHDDRKGNQFILFSKAVIKDFRILWDKISQNNFEVHSFIVWETILCNVIYRVFSNLCNSGFFFSFDSIQAVKNSTTLLRKGRQKERLFPSQTDK